MKSYLPKVTLVLILLMAFFSFSSGETKKSAINSFNVNSQLEVLSVFSTNQVKNLPEALRQKISPDANNSFENARFTILSTTLAEDGSRLVEILMEAWITGAWQDSAKYIFNYDVNGNLIEQITQTWSVGNWVNEFRILSSYDANGRVTETIFQEWDNDAWVNLFKTLYVYDQNGNSIEETMQSWGNDIWNNSAKTLNTYDANNNITEKLQQYWDQGVWVDGMKTVYTYDGNGKKIEELVTLLGMNYSRKQFSYDGNGNLIETVNQNWDFISSWLNFSRELQSWDANGNMVESISQIWGGTAWADNTRRTYTYDGSFQLTEMLEQIWADPTWQNVRKTSYLYELRANISAELIQVWENETWVNSERWTYTYGTQVAIDIPDITPANFYLAQNYPNPFNPVTTISFNLPKASQVELSIFNITGEKVATLVKENKNAGVHKINFDGKDLPSGAYFYKLTTEDQSAVKKLLLIK